MALIPLARPWPGGGFVYTGLEDDPALTGVLTSLHIFFKPASSSLALSFSLRTFVWLFFQSWSRVLLDELLLCDRGGFTIQCTHPVLSVNWLYERNKRYFSGSWSDWGHCDVLLPPHWTSAVATFSVHPHSDKSRNSRPGVCTDFTASRAAYMKLSLTKW